MEWWGRTGQFLALLHCHAARPQKQLLPGCTARMTVDLRSGAGVTEPFVMVGWPGPGTGGVVWYHTVALGLPKVVAVDPTRTL